jgi:RNA polymerase sigma factor (sigma-70 family)
MSDPDATVRDLARGDESAWARLLDDHGRLVMLACRRARLTPSESDDVFQTTFLSAYRAIGSLRDAAALPAWLYRIAERAALAHVRKRRPSTSIEDPDGPQLEAELSQAATQLDLLTAFEDAAAIREAVSRLEPRDRDLLDALYFETPRPSYEEVSARLDMPIGSIGPTRARALTKLRKFYDEVSEGGGPTPPIRVR